MTNLVYPEDRAVKCWSKQGIYYSLVYHEWPELFFDAIYSGLSSTYYTGYCRFAARPLIEEGYEGIATYVPVHGGITYAKEDEYGMVYGFDCLHAEDAYNDDLKDIDWLMQECENMARGIQIAAFYEQHYLDTEDDNQLRAEVIDQMHYETRNVGLDTTIVYDNPDVLLNILSGEL